MTEDTKRQKRLRVIALFTIIALVLGLVGGWAIAAATTSNDDGDVWVVQAQTASVADDTVFLNNVGGSVVQVTAEDREVSSVSISQLTQDWSNEFGDTKPRAVIAGIIDGENHSIIVSLGVPTATADSITFEGSEVEGGGDVPANFVAATVLIDNEGLIEAKLRETNEG